MITCHRCIGKNVELEQTDYLIEDDYPHWFFKCPECGCRYEIWELGDDT